MFFLSVFSLEVLLRFHVSLKESGSAERGSWDVFLYSCYQEDKDVEQDVGSEMGSCSRPNSSQLGITSSNSLVDKDPNRKQKKEGKPV